MGDFVVGDRVVLLDSGWGANALETIGLTGTVCALRVGVAGVEVVGVEFDQQIPYGHACILDGVPRGRHGRCYWYGGRQSDKLAYIEGDRCAVDDGDLLTMWEDI